MSEALRMTKMKVLSAAVLSIGAALWLGPQILSVTASDPGSGDWPMWGGAMDRNMVSNAKGIVSKWDVAKKDKVLWVQALGSQTYGNPVVAHGQVYVGTNNEGVRDPKQP